METRPGPQLAKAILAVAAPGIEEVQPAFALPPQFPGWHCFSLRKQSVSHFFPELFLWSMARERCGLFWVLKSHHTGTKKSQVIDQIRLVFM
jgi:hypothetical protein